MVNRTSLSRTSSIITRLATVSVLLNTTAIGATTPSFGPPKTFAAGAPSAFITGDVNGDGMPDIIVPIYGTNTLAVFFDTTPPGATTPTFAGPQIVRSDNKLSGFLAASVAVADINGDGYPDLIVPNYALNTVSVLLNETKTATGTIIESDPPPTVSFAKSNESLGENAGTFSIPVNLSAASPVDTTIPFTLGGTAVSGKDYTVDNSSLTIPAGQTIGAITGTLNNDYAVDGPVPGR